MNRRSGLLIWQFNYRSQLIQDRRKREQYYIINDKEQELCCHYETTLHT